MNTLIFVHSMLSKIHCAQETTLGSLFGMLFVTAYFSIFLVFLYAYVCLHCAALVRNK